MAYPWALFGAVLLLPGRVRHGAAPLRRPDAKKGGPTVSGPAQKGLAKLGQRSPAADLRIAEDQASEANAATLLMLMGGCRIRLQPGTPGNHDVLHNRHDDVEPVGLPARARRGQERNGLP
jgi:hypothetical protein